MGQIKIRDVLIPPINVNYRNNVPLSWNVVIAAVSFRATYRDNSQYTFGPKEVHIEPQQVQTFTADSSTADRCCKDVVVMCDAVSDGHDHHQCIQEMQVPDGKCLVNVTLTINPKTEVSASRKRGLADLIEVKLD